ncbi:hypothetical protein QJS10_CPB13g00158 [Acorus calamus]|uniref:Uncharacterized protein n=1 Tax=Acorus calamus TaxID=4465 RepID=A0AAV9DG74_ACOCL|nr:hypothetical protein QJS10_CPB13g00158 [Acorus calamus]
MSNLMEVCMSELTKLAHRLSEPSRGKRKAGKEEPAESRADRVDAPSGVSISEATLFMVMDRFAPC